MSLNDDAKRIAEKFGIDQDRVVRVLKKSGLFGPSYDVPEATARSLPWLVEPPSLEELCRCIPAQDALSAFEGAKPWLVRRRRELLMMFVPSYPYPFYTLSELAELIDAFADHLVDECEGIVANGHAPNPFARSSWIDAVMAMHPAMIPPNEDTRDDLLGLNILVCGELLDGVKRRLDKGKWHGKRIATELWEKCTAIVSEELASSEGLQDLLGREIEALSLWHEDGGKDPASLALVNGGTTALLIFALYVCKEIAIGTCDKTRAALGPLVGLDPDGCAVLKGEAIDGVYGCKSLLRKRPTDNEGQIGIQKADALFHRLIQGQDEFMTIRVSDFQKVVSNAVNAAISQFLAQLMTGTDAGFGGGGSVPPGRSGRAFGRMWGWEDVTIALEGDGETLDFCFADGISQRHHYADLSFSDARISTRSRMHGSAARDLDCWQLFREMLQSNIDQCGRGHYYFRGEIDADGSSERKAIQTINGKLLEGTGIKDGENPIVSDGPHSYCTRFKVRGAVDAASPELDILDDPAEALKDAKHCRAWVETRLEALGKANPMLGEARSLLPVYVALRVIAEQPDQLAPVLIYGAQGTGKELLMRLIHDISEATGRYIPFNVTGVPDNMIESTLFGIVKGAATGVEASPGLFEEAASGTLVLDCMEEARGGLQDKLLRAVDPTTRTYRPVGVEEDKQTKCRVLMAFNQPLPLLIQQKKLRSDLLDRFDLQIVLPPLDSRREDIPQLVRHFAQEYLHEEKLTRLAPRMEELFSISGLIRSCEEQSWSTGRQQDLNIRGLRKYIRQRMATQKRRHVDAGTITIPGARIEEMSPSAFADCLRDIVPDETVVRFRRNNRLKSFENIAEVFGAAETRTALAEEFGYGHPHNLRKTLTRLKAYPDLRDALVRRFDALSA